MSAARTRPARRRPGTANSDSDAQSASESAHPDYRVVAHLPWHEAPWRMIEGAVGQGRLHHALLLRGPRGVGKRCFAGALAAALLCAPARPYEPACGQCRPCRLRLAGNHPDLHWLVPEPDKRSIGVDAVREAIEAISLTSQSDSPKIVIVAPAEALTGTAANTLLKTLEEPPGACQFMLLAVRAGLLLPTIRSRCQAVRLSVPDRAAAMQWMRAAAVGAARPDDPAALEQALTSTLDRCGGAPLAALELLRSGTLGRRDEVLRDVLALAFGKVDPAKVSRAWLVTGLTETLDHLDYAACGLLKARLAPGTVMWSDDARTQVCALDLTEILALQAACTALRRTLSSEGSLNEDLALSAVAAQCTGLQGGSV